MRSLRGHYGEGDGKGVLACRISDKGHSEVRTTSVQRKNEKHKLVLQIHLKDGGILTQTRFSHHLKLLD